MVNLIKNELFKVIKKKGFIIMIIVMFAYAVLTNFIYKTLSTYIVNSEVPFVDEVDNEYDPNNKSDLPYYVDQKTMNDLIKIRDGYDSKSWQYNYILMGDMYETLYPINSYEAKLTSNEDEYKKAKEEYNYLLKQLDNDDWKAIAKTTKDKYENELSTVEDDSYKAELKIKIEELNIRLEKDISYKDDYLNNSLIQYTDSKKELLRYSNKDIDKLSNSEKEDYYNQREIYLSNEYALEHNIDINSMGSLKQIMSGFFNEYLLMLIIMIFMIAGSITSQEFSNGTIKMLLLKPYSRYKILLSKYITVLLSIVMSFVIMLIIQLIVGGLFFGFKSLSDPVLVYSSINDSLEAVNVFNHVLMNFVGLLPCFILLSTLAFATSTLFTNTALSVVIGFVGYIGGNMISELLSSLKYWWIKYIFCFNWDLTPYIFNTQPLIKGTSLMFSIIVCVVYLLALLIPTFIIFKRKDITNV